MSIHFVSDFSLAVWMKSVFILSCVGQLSEYFFPKKCFFFTEKFMRRQVHEFEIGKRHLANMMGEDPEHFTQEDIDVSSVYVGRE